MLSIYIYTQIYIYTIYIWEPATHTYICIHFFSFSFFYVSMMGRCVGIRSRLPQAIDILLEPCVVENASRWECKSWGNAKHLASVLTAVAQMPRCMHSGARSRICESRSRSAMLGVAMCPMLPSSSSWRRF